MLLDLVISHPEARRVKPRNRGTTRYSTVQPVIDMLIPTVACRGPEIQTTTVGKTVKYPPFAMPLKMAKVNSDGGAFGTGQIASMLTVLIAMVITEAFAGPIPSYSGPPVKQPSGLQALNAATSPASVLDDGPNDCANKGQ
jgi:hypothetical protein